MTCTSDKGAGSCATGMQYSARSLLDPFLFLLLAMCSISFELDISGATIPGCRISACIATCPGPIKSNTPRAVGREKEVEVDLDEVQLDIQAVQSIPLGFRSPSLSSYMDGCLKTDLTRFFFFLSRSTEMDEP